MTVKLEGMKLADFAPNSSTVIIGNKAGDDGAHTKASALHEIFKMIAPGKMQMHVDPDPEDGHIPQESEFKIMEHLFDYVLIYPESPREAFSRTLDYLKVEHVEQKIDWFLSQAKGLPMVILLRESPVEIKKLES
nr:hypothetical protein [Sicyoidochytrium minutum DNA virus]